MATPVTDLEQRPREAEFTEAQARALASGFEALDRRLDGPERRVERVEATLRIVIAMQLVTIDAVLAPYIGRLFSAGS